MEVIIDTPDFNYLNYGGASILSLIYTFDVDTQSELYRFMKSRLNYPTAKITILIE